MKNNNKNDDSKKKWKNFGIYALLSFVVILFSIVVINLGTTLLNSYQSNQREWTYSKLLEEVRKKPTGVSRITISQDRSFAEVTISASPEGKKRVRVNLPSNPDFIKAIRENNIELDVAPRRDDGSLVQTLINLVLQILFLVGLFFLLLSNLSLN